ncbi:MAG: isoprenylcysteine carboxylmethyltransferase family protein [Candidatus Bathyarchaeota archaeon]|nr:isoprenylcysteine carboxylmethyltransferase family protein [Candidatus Bathyarchaeota archaeon]
MSNHEHKALGEEYPGSDQMQVVMLVIFLAVWAGDSFLLHISTFTSMAPWFLRFPVAVLLVGIGVYLINESHKLVIDMDEPCFVDWGVFSRVRHPMYLGIQFIYLAFTAATLSATSVLVWAFIFQVYNRFAAYEEKELIETLGTTYVEYMKNVPRWNPLKLS